LGLGTSFDLPYLTPLYFVIQWLGVLTS
jgi:hypothetical protein